MLEYNAAAFDAGHWDWHPKPDLDSVRGKRWKCLRELSPHYSSKNKGYFNINNKESHNPKNMKDHPKTYKSL